MSFTFTSLTTRRLFTAHREEILSCLLCIEDDTHRTSAINYYFAGNNRNANINRTEFIVCNPIASALSLGFSWHNTREGYSYWENVCASHDTDSMDLTYEDIMHRSYLRVKSAESMDRAINVVLNHLPMYTASRALASRKQFLKTNSVVAYPRNIEGDIYTTYKNESARGLCLAFDWSKTPEGYAFWNNIVNNESEHKVLEVSSDSDRLLLPLRKVSISSKGDVDVLLRGNKINPFIKGKRKLL